MDEIRDYQQKLMDKEEDLKRILDKLSTTEEACDKVGREKRDQHREMMQSSLVLHRSVLPLLLVVFS